MSRKTLVLEVDDAAPEALLRRYHAFLQEMSALALTAPEGRVLDQLEDLALEQGRDTLRATLEQAAQHRLNAAEKKGPGSAAARAANRVKTAAPPPASSQPAWARCACNAAGGGSAAPAPSPPATTPMRSWVCKVP